MGFNFPYSDQVSIWLNGRFIGAVPGPGWFQFQLDTARAADELYIVVTQAGSVTATHWFVSAATPWEVGTDEEDDAGSWSCVLGD